MSTNTKCQGAAMVAREGGGSAPAVAATELLADGSYLQRSERLCGTTHCSGGVAWRWALEEAPCP